MALRVLDSLSRREGEVLLNGAGRRGPGDEVGSWVLAEARRGRDVRKRFHLPAEPRGRADGETGAGDAVDAVDAYAGAGWWAEGKARRAVVAALGRVLGGRRQLRAHWPARTGTSVTSWTVAWTTKVALAVWRRVRPGGVERKAGSAAGMSCAHSRARGREGGRWSWEDGAAGAAGRRRGGAGAGRGGDGRR